MTEKHDVIFDFAIIATFRASWSLDFGRTFYKNFDFIFNSFLFYIKTA